MLVIISFRRMLVRNIKEFESIKKVGNDNKNDGNDDSSDNNDYSSDNNDDSCNRTIIEP